MLRIIGGKAKGRLLKVPKGSKIRPTSDKVRESLFNIIGPPAIKEARFLDLFAGSGAIGIEALSRGARSTTFVESNPKHARVIKINLEICGLQEHAEVICGDVSLVLDRLSLSRPSYDIIFIDPPYNFSKWKMLLLKISKSVSISSYGFSIIEHSSRVSMPDNIDDIFRFACAEQSEECKHCILYGIYTYGDTTLTVYRIL